MPYRPPVLFLSALLALFCALTIYSQTDNLESFVIKPGQAVYIFAVKGECGGGMQSAMMMVNGRPILMPRHPLSGANQEQGQRQTLEHYEPLPLLAKMIGQALQEDKTFVVVDAPEKADFIFRVCAAYTDDLIESASIKRMGVTEKLEFAEARVFPVAAYRTDQEGMSALMWKAKTPDAQRPIKINTKPDEKKKKKEKPPAPSQGRIIINGVPMDLTQSALNPAEINDLVTYFLQDYKNLAAVKIPKTQIVNTSTEDQPNRPALTNKPDDAPLEKARPALVNTSGEPLTAAKTEAATKPATETEEVIKVDTALVYVPVRVLDKDGKYIPDLTKKDFKVFEDSVAQEIEKFSNVDDPFHVVLLLDMSGSTRFKVEEIQDAALEFVEQLRPQDRVMVASFESAIFIDADFTSDRMKLTKAILRTRTGRSTRLYDAVDLVLTERLNRIQGRKAIVLFSDGVDSFSKGATLQENLSKIEESNVLVYPIHYDTMPDLSQAAMANGNQMPAPMMAERLAKVKETYDRAKMYMTELAIRSGGRSYEAATLTDAKTAFANIAEELRRQYWLSYYSTNPKDDGSYRKIRVTVVPADDKKWAVRAKNGYRAPKK